MKEIKREIYGCLCIKTNKWYVGRALRGFYETRLNGHRHNYKSFLKGKYKSCSVFYNAIKKYGGFEKFEQEKTWKIYILEKNVPEDKFEKREIYWTMKKNAMVKNGYVLVAGGGNEQIISEETRRKMIETGKRKKWIPPNKGKKLSLEYRIKLSKSKDEMKRKVLQYDLNNNLIREFESRAAAIKECNLNRGTLGKVLKGKGKSCGGFIWKYKEEKRNID